jgi:hypothetical protein
MERMIDAFDAVSSNGKRCRIQIFQDFLEVTSMGQAARSYLPGLKRASLSDGTPLNHIDDDTFKNVETDEIVQRIDT